MKEVLLIIISAVISGSLGVFISIWHHKKEEKRKIKFQTLKKCVKI